MRALPRHPWTNGSGAACLTLGRAQVVSDLQRVVLCDITGRTVEHPALPRGRHLGGPHTGAGGTHCATAAAGFLAKTFLDISPVPGP